MRFKVIDTFGEYPIDYGIVGDGYSIEEFMLGSYPSEYLIHDGSEDLFSLMFNPRYEVVLIEEN
jgi:hypothetical protein